MRAAHCCVAAYPLPQPPRAPHILQASKAKFQLASLLASDCPWKGIMTRFTENEKAMLSRAMLPAGVAASADSVGSALGALLGAIRRPFRHASIVRELTRLDDRMLADIGVRRWDIETVAETAAAAEGPSLVEALGGVVIALGKAVGRWQERRTAVRELSELDDRMLSDIGISRSEIPAVVAGRTRAAAMAPAAVDGDALEVFRRWNLSRIAAKELNGLDNDILDDLGLVRGDIDDVVEELAIRALKPANRNSNYQAA
jgi:uncharacterized protein YjiS (DUF1127 family)